jgi:hypothetical protein
MIQIALLQSGSLCAGSAGKVEGMDFNQHMFDTNKISRLALLMHARFANPDNKKKPPKSGASVNSNA